jgi:hypothetical protein
MGSGIVYSGGSHGCLSQKILHSYLAFYWYMSTEIGCVKRAYFCCWRYKWMHGTILWLVHPFSYLSIGATFFLRVFMIFIFWSLLCILMTKMAIKIFLRVLCTLCNLRGKEEVLCVFTNISAMVILVSILCWK